MPPAEEVDACGSPTAEPSVSQSAAAQSVSQAGANRLMIFTWNVGNESPQEDQLKTWLPAGGDGIDILVVATQENAYHARDGEEEDFVQASTSGLPPSQLSSFSRTVGTQDSTTPRSETGDQGPNGDEISQQISDRPLAEQPLPRRFRKILRSKGGASSSVGKSDWSTTFLCGYNLMGAREHAEHWENIILNRLNTGASSDSPRWRIYKHAVLAQTRLTVYARNARDNLMNAEICHLTSRPSLKRSASNLFSRVPSFLISRHDAMPGYVSLSRRDRIPLGKLGLANKGALAIELKINGAEPGDPAASVLILGCHLEAHREGIHKRNAQTQAVFHYLQRRGKLGFARDRKGFETKLDIANQYDHVFVVGDLNYRIDFDLPRREADLTSRRHTDTLGVRQTSVDQIDIEAQPNPMGKEGSVLQAPVLANSSIVGVIRRYTSRPGPRARQGAYIDSAQFNSRDVINRLVNPDIRLEHARRAKELVKQGDWQTLHDADQLLSAKRHGHALLGFMEAPLLFPPTFKVTRQAGIHYQVGEVTPAKCRVPSYCERILWRSKPHLKDSLLVKGSEQVMDVTTSDHKPLVSSFVLLPTPPHQERIPHTHTTLRLDVLRLVGEPGASLTAITRSNRAKLRFTTHPANLLQVSTSRSSLNAHKQTSHNSSKRKECHANVRTRKLPLSDATVDERGCKVLAWDADSVPELILACRASELSRATLTISLYCYGSRGSRSPASRLRGSVELQLQAVGDGAVIATSVNPSHNQCGSPSISPGSRSPSSGNISTVPISDAPTISQHRMELCASYTPLSLHLKFSVEDESDKSVHTTLRSRVLASLFGRKPSFHSNGALRRGLSAPTGIGHQGSSFIETSEAESTVAALPNDNGVAQMNTGRSSTPDDLCNAVVLPSRGATAPC